MKIPTHAKLVFKGVIFQVYQWQQKLYDGSTATFEALKRPNTIQIIPIMDNKILLAFEEQPTKALSYTLFGGRQEEKEEALVTAKRELLEETGLASDNWELIKTYHNEGKIDWDVYLYVARNCRKVSEQNLDAGEKIEVRPVTFENFLDTVSSEAFWGQMIANDILRLRLDEKKLVEFKKKIFH